MLHCMVHVTFSGLVFISRQKETRQNYYPEHLIIAFKAPENTRDYATSLCVCVRACVCVFQVDISLPKC